MDEKKLRKRYDKMLSQIDNMQIYDGRNKGIDVYVCDKCKTEFYTQYKNKGITPFCIKCNKDGCDGTMTHDDTISIQIAAVIGAKVHNWVRPSFEQFKTLNRGMQEHILDGGLMLEDDLADSKTAIKDKFDKIHDILDSMQDSGATCLFIGDEGNHFVISGDSLNITAQIIFAMCRYPVVKEIINTCAARFDKLNEELGDDIRNVTLDHLIEHNSGN